MPWRHIGEWRYFHAFLNLGTRWRWVVISRPGRPSGKSPRYLSGRRLGGPQSQSRRGGEDKNNPCPCRESNLDRPAWSLVIILSYASSCDTVLLKKKSFIFGLYCVHRIVSEYAESAGSFDANGRRIGVTGGVRDNDLFWRTISPFPAYPCCSKTCNANLYRRTDNTVWCIWRPRFTAFRLLVTMFIIE
jgi:hypothetical protein